jgi:HKD family nuclease
MNIYTRVSYLAKLALQFDFAEYLSKENKQLLIFEIDTQNKTYKLFECENIDHLLEQTNNNYIDAKAGYLFNVKSIFNTNTEADLLLLSDIVINSNPIDLDTIIIHELVHFIIESGRSSLIEISKEANALGVQIYNLTDKPEEWRTRHNVDFCKSLAQACISYNNITRNFKNSEFATESAMRFDIFL